MLGTSPGVPRPNPHLDNPNLVNRNPKLEPKLATWDDAATQCPQFPSELVHCVSFVLSLWCDVTNTLSLRLSLSLVLTLALALILTLTQTLTLTLTYPGRQVLR